MPPAVAALVIGIVLLVLAYTIPQIPPPVRQLLLVFGWILAIIGGVFLVLALLGLQIAAPGAR
jgi:hypothetical protein